jgi:apolipoprotein D and lipocalin family protein
MNAIHVLALLVCALVGTCAANTYRMGGCPRVSVMKNIDFEKFLGDWYVIQRFNPMATCTKLTIEKGPEDQYFVNETSRPFGFNLNFHNQYLKARKLNFLRNDTNSIFRLQRNFAHFSLSTFGIVDTDYENYAVVWGCDPVLFGSVQNVDILSRDPKASKDTIKKAKDAMKEMNVDIYPLDNVDQTRCIFNTDSADGTKSEADKNTNNIVVENP